MVLNPAWRPPEEIATILNERTWLAGIILSGVAYGVVLTLSVMSFFQLLTVNGGTTKKNIRPKAPLVVYVFSMFILGTLIIGAGSKFTQMSFIDYRMIPGGPAVFEEAEFSNPVDMVATVAYVVANWLADGIMVYRYMIIYRGCRLPSWLVMGVPLAAYLGSIATGILWLIQDSTTSPWSQASTGRVNFTDPYYWLSLALNIIITIAICSRLLYYRRRMMNILGTEHGSQYTGVAAMIVESAVLYSAFSLCFLIPFVLGNPIQNTFIQMLGEVQIIAPLLIIYRVAYGKAWTEKTNQELLTKEYDRNQVTTVRFRHHTEVDNISGYLTTTVDEAKAEQDVRHSRTQTPFVSQ